MNGSAEIGSGGRRSRPDGPRVAIAGGSLGGLTAALVLRDLGCDVQVFERSRRPLSGRGVGIVAHPATIRYPLERGGVDPTSPVRFMRYLDPDGEIAHEEESRFRFTSYHALHRALLGLFDRDRYHLEHEVRGFSEDSDTVTVELADGRRHACELLVCADGIQSAARRLLLPDLGRTYSGYVGWRGALQESALDADAHAVLADSLTYCVIPHSHILTYPIPSADQAADDEDRTINWVWYRNVEEGEELERIVTDVDGRAHEISLGPGEARREHVARVREDANEVLAPQLARMVRATAEPFLQVVFDIEVPRMAFGRICLIGDAACALRPHIAVGTAKAAEAAWMLADALEASDRDVVEALRRWEPEALALEHHGLARTREAGNRIQHECSWRIGEPIPFGLRESGDSAFPPPSRAGA